MHDVADWLWSPAALGIPAAIWFTLACFVVAFIAAWNER